MTTPKNYPTVSGGLGGGDLWRRPGPTADQRRIDLAIGAAVAALALFNLTLTTSAGQFAFGPPPTWPEQMLWTIAGTLPLIWRRSRPNLVATVIAIAFIGGQFRAAPETQLASGALFAAIYAAGAWAPDRGRSKQVRAVIIAAMFGWIGVHFIISIDAVPPDAFDGAQGPVPPILAAMVSTVLINMLIFGFAYFFGETAWIAARRQHELEVQAEQLRRSQAEASERAVMDERVRIARELHDVVAHHVSVMGVQAAAGRRVLEKDLTKARTALAAIEQSARTAVEELRRMLGLLRQSGGRDQAAADSGAPATVGIDRIEKLLEGTREAGLTTRYGVYGEPVPLPESLSQAAFRIVQESVTNTLKHANASTIDVRVRYLAHELEIESTDDGRGLRVGTAPGGMGLIGMRERAAAHDGLLEAGPRPGGGFRVRARFPLTRVEVNA